MRDDDNKAPPLAASHWPAAESEGEKPEKPEQGKGKMWPIVVDLKTPIDLGKSSVSRIELRRGRLGDIKGMQLSERLPADHLLLIASRLSGQPLGVIERLDMDDSGEIMEAVLDFYGRCLGAGSRP